MKWKLLKHLSILWLILIIAYLGSILLTDGIFYLAWNYTLIGWLSLLGGAILEFALIFIVVVFGNAKI